MAGVKDEVEVNASLDPNKKCIAIDGDGAAWIRFDTDATQLAPVLTVLARFKGCGLKLKISKLKEGLGNAGRKKQGKTYR